MVYCTYVQSGIQYTHWVEKDFINGYYAHYRSLEYSSAHATKKVELSLFFESTSILGSELQLWPCVCTNPPLEMSASLLLRRRGGAGTRQHHDLVQKRTLRILCTTPRRRMLLQKIIFALLMHSVSARDIATHSYHLQKQIFLVIVNQSESLIK